MSTNIPKIVHYCWFGKSEKTKKIKKCINTWKKILYDYEFIEWNESNFDINYNLYVKQSYELKKYAFVSDVARILALKKYGGIYLDTDVKVVKKFDDLLDSKCIFGFEERNRVATSFMAAEPNHPVFQEFLAYYDNLRFIMDDGNMDLTPNVNKLGRILEDKGLNFNGEFQKLDDGVIVYPKEYFSPYDYINCINESNINKYCIHLFFVTWMPVQIRIKKTLKKIIVKLIGKRNMESLRKKYND